MVMGERELREIEACCMLRDELHGKGRTRNHRDCSTWLARKQEPQREEMQKRGWPRRENFRGARFGEMWVQDCRVQRNAAMEMQ